jgi:hypothetical protein
LANIEYEVVFFDRAAIFVLPGCSGITLFETNIDRIHVRDANPIDRAG